MKERERQPEITAEKKEYTFEEGVERVMRKINLLLSTQDYVTIAIAGPAVDDSNVGKTTLQGSIAKECYKLGFPVATLADEDLFSTLNTGEHIKLEQRIKNSKKGVIILGAMSSPGSYIRESEEEVEKRLEEFRDLQDNGVKRAANLVGLPLSKVDIRVLIYRPDRQIEDGDRIFPDIIIKNEAAKNKNAL